MTIAEKEQPEDAAPEAEPRPGGEEAKDPAAARSSAAPVTAPRRRVKRRKQPEATVPLFGGRLWLGVAMLVGLGLIANPVFNQWIARLVPPEQSAPPARWQVGSTATVYVTLITADAARLACAHDDGVDGAHCAYDGKRTRRSEPEVPPDEAPDLIQPYKTPEDHLILIAGLWSQPALALRLHQEPPAGVPVKRLRRFVAKCEVRFVGELDGVKLRWEDGGSWLPQEKAMVARPEACSVRYD